VRAEDRIFLPLNLPMKPSPVWGNALSLLNGSGTICWSVFRSRLSLSVRSSVSMFYRALAV